MVSQGFRLASPPTQGFQEALPLTVTTSVLWFLACEGQKPDLVSVLRVGQALSDGCLQNKVLGDEGVEYKPNDHLLDDVGLRYSCSPVSPSLP